MVVPEMFIANVIEVIPVTEKSKDNIMGADWLEEKTKMGERNAS